MVRQILLVGWNVIMGGEASSLPGYYPCAILRWGLEKLARAFEQVFKHSLLENSIWLKRARLNKWSHRSACAFLEEEEEEEKEGARLWSQAGLMMSYTWPWDAFISHSSLSLVLFSYPTLVNVMRCTVCYQDYKQIDMMDNYFVKDTTEASSTSTEKSTQVRDMRC